LNDAVFVEAEIAFIRRGDNQMVDNWKAEKCRGPDYPLIGDNASSEG
jgi:hypothetical protein